MCTVKCFIWRSILRITWWKSCSRHRVC